MSWFPNSPSLRRSHLPKDVRNLQTHLRTHPKAGETTLPNANAKQNPLDLNRLDSWLRAMRNPAEAVETLQPEILHVPINYSKASVLPEALHDTPIPTPLGESWTGPPLSRQEVESRLQQQSLQSKTWTKKTSMVFRLAHSYMPYKNPVYSFKGSSIYPEQRWSWTRTLTWSALP